MEDSNFFKQFLDDAKNEVAIIMMKDAVEELKLGIGHYKMPLLRVKAANATCDTSFCDATCSVQPFYISQTEELEAMASVIAMGRLFPIGVKILEALLSDHCTKLPLEKPIRNALCRLLQFLSSDHSVLTRKREVNEYEHVLALRYAEHLLMPLVDGKIYWIDSDTTRCCDTEHKHTGVRGDTSYGVNNGWHGKADILIMNEDKNGLPVFIGESPDDDTTVSLSEEDFSQSGRQQIIAETIVFSFLQHKLNEKTLKNFLIPGIGICNGKAIVYFYDCEEDILLHTLSLDLISPTGEVDVYCIICLWLTLNYELFCTGVTDDCKKYRSGFYDILSPEYMELYRNEVSIPYHTKDSEKRSYEQSLAGMTCRKKLKREDMPEVPLQEI